MMFEVWVARSENKHPQRPYRRDVVSPVEFLGIEWPIASCQLLKTGAADVRCWRIRDDEWKRYAKVDPPGTRIPTQP